MAEVKQVNLSCSEERNDEKIREEIKMLLLESSSHSDFVQRCEAQFGEEIKDIKVAWGSAYRATNLYFSDAVVHASVRLEKGRKTEA